MLLTSCLASLLCFGLPDYLPGKRAFAMHLLLFHGFISAIFLQVRDGIIFFELPKFVLELIPAAAQVKNTVWIAATHGLISFVAVLWYVYTHTHRRWQATLPLVKAVTAHAKAE